MKITCTLLYLIQLVVSDSVCCLALSRSQGNRACSPDPGDVKKRPQGNFHNIHVVIWYIEYNPVLFLYID